MDKIIIGICDDEARSREDARRVLEDAGLLGDSFDVRLLTPNDLKYDLEEDTLPYSILILDIEFMQADFNGIELAGEINKKAPGCLIIYLTHIINFAPDVYETEHCYFVLKSNMEKMLPLAVKKALRLMKNDEARSTVSFVCESKQVLISQSSIIYIEKEERILIIHTADKAYKVYGTLNNFIKQLKDEFIRVHGSFVVNLSFVSDIFGSELELKDGTNIPVGKTFAPALKKAFMNYWAKQI